MNYDDDNIFARMLRGEIPCEKIFEDEHSFAFLDIMPRAPGHTLVIPRAKASGFLDIGADDLCRLMVCVQKLAPVIVKALDADGFMLQQFNGAGAGQTVFHLHIHIVPRYAGRPLRPHGEQMEDTDVLAGVGAKIRAALGG